MSMSARILRSLSVFGVLSALLLMWSPVASAGTPSKNNPFCFDLVQEVDCTKPSNVQMINSATGSNPQAGKCYGFGYGIVTMEYNSADCLIQIAKFAEFGPAKCYKLSEDINKYYQMSFDVNKMSTAPCDDTMLFIFTATQSGFKFLPGSCYILANDNETTSDLCTSFDQAMLTASGGRTVTPGGAPVTPTPSGGGGGGGGGGGTGTTAAAVAPTSCTDADLTKNCKIVDYLILAINILSAMVGIVVVAMVIVGGIQYTTAADDPQAVAKAKSKIIQALLALVVFIFSYSLLQWLVPGGVFK